MGDVVLLSLRDFQDEKADIIHKYNNDEIRDLKKMSKDLN
jgi:translation initiation factor 1A